MGISGVAAVMGGIPAGRLQLEVGTAVLDKALDASVTATMSLIAGMPKAIPEGLTYSPSGLSSGSSGRLIANL
jgi:hypothetical protein